MEYSGHTVEEIKSACADLRKELNKVLTQIEREVTVPNT
jgi:hypothetical protein